MNKRDYIAMKNKFSENLRTLRLELGLSQKVLAEKLGKKRTSVFEWETNGHEPDYDTLIEIANFFNVTLDYLLGRTEF